MEQMINKKKIVLICARSGSKGIKDKNIQKIGKFNLLKSTINQAKKIPSINLRINRLVDINLLQKKQNIVPFLRSKILSKITHLMKVWQNLINKMRFKDDQIIATCQPHPNRKLSDINKGLNYLKKIIMI